MPKGRGFTALLVIFFCLFHFSSSSLSAVDYRENLDHSSIVGTIYAKRPIAMPITAMTTKNTKQLLMALEKYRDFNMYILIKVSMSGSSLTLL